MHTPYWQYDVQHKSTWHRSRSPLNIFAKNNQILEMALSSSRASYFHYFHVRLVFQSPLLAANDTRSRRGSTWQSAKSSSRLGAEEGKIGKTNPRIARICTRSRKKRRRWNIQRDSSSRERGRDEREIQRRRYVNYLLVLVPAQSEIFARPPIRDV